VLQVDARVPDASMTRPVMELRDFRRLSMEPGGRTRVAFHIPTDLFSFTGIDYRRVVEPGTIEVMLGRSSADIRLRVEIVLTGGVRVVGEGRALVSTSEVDLL